MIRTIRPEIAQYHIEEFLGEGSMASVYKATREDSRGFSRQTVALKVLKSQDQVRSLVFEMETLSKVRSPYCVSFLGWENLPEGPAIVMEWVDGVSLEVLSKSSRLDPLLIDEILVQTEFGLADLKRAGRCHGDLSPSNVLIDVHGRVRLVDFGLSRAREDGSVSGTAPFMSPERWEGGSPSIESDLFSLGLIELELKCGATSLASAVYRERARKAATAEPGWLALQPESRTFRARNSNPSIARKIGREVQNALARRSFAARTLRLEGAGAGTWVRHMGVSFALVLTLLFPIAPFGETDRVLAIPSARLEIRTLRWVHARLGFTDLGFSPLVREGIPAGLYRLHWKSAAGAGSKLISIGYGERKLLTDRDF
ncbi:MAG: serine/threonine-protein kinase [Bdellovibrionia bacterium]